MRTDVAIRSGVPYQIFLQNHHEKVSEQILEPVGRQISEQVYEQVWGQVYWQVWNQSKKRSQ